MSSNNKTFHKKIANTGQPKYRLLADQLRSQIQSRELVTGDRLPSFTEMRLRFGITSTTIERAYGLLEQEGLIERRSGSGVYVAPPENSQTGNIGLVLRFTPTYESLYMHSLLEGIHAACQQEEMGIKLIEGDEFFDYQQVDGVLLHWNNIETYTTNIPQTLPLVTLLRCVDGMSAVTVDDFGGSKQATSHLIQLGHQRIACLMEEKPAIAVKRRSGYLAAMQEAGIIPQSNWLRLPEEMLYPKDGNYLQWGRRHMREWLEEGWEEMHCTAIVAQNDYVAIGVMQVLQEAGVDVPKQVSIIGFDGTDVCDLASPSLTSIEAPLYRVGYQAVKVLCDQIKNGSQTPREISLPVRLRKGNSVSKN